MRFLLVWLLIFSLGYNISLYQKVVDLEGTSALKVKLKDRQIIKLTKELKEYEITSQWLIELGASPEEALETIKAAEVHCISPKSMAL